MLKLLAIFLTITLAAVNGSMHLGGYSDRPELLQDAKVQELAVYVSEHLATTQNLILDHIQMTGVQTQTVAGTNYKIEFTAQSISPEPVTCEAVIYVRFDGTKTVTRAQCQPAHALL